MAKYRVRDLYDFDCELLYCGFSLEDAQNAARRRIDETGGVCIPVIEKWTVKEKQHYTLKDGRAVIGSVEEPWEWESIPWDCERRK